MKAIDNMIVKENEIEFNGQKYKVKQLYVVVGDKEYLIGTLKEKEKYNFINCIHKEFKKN